MVFQYFTGAQLLPLLIAAVLIVAAAITFHLDLKKTGLILLILGSVAIGFFMANLDPFLVLWDEQYHALVAKNMMVHPFTPQLYTAPLLDFDVNDWTSNHIWLHKQPLFLWQIALSLKIFGTNTLAVRIPSILMHAAMIYPIYRMGAIAHNERVGFLGALFFTLAYYPLELIAGRFCTDHNDVAFLFFVTCSFWAWFEYRHSGKNYWLFLIGMFAGSAVLVKWLVGLLVFGCWFLAIPFGERKEALKWKSWRPLIISAGISLLVFLPWQLYILNTFPEQARYEFRLNSEHFFRAVEDHGGNVWFHFNAAKDLYGSADAMPFILLLGVFLLIRYSSRGIYRAMFLIAVIFTYGFYTMAATKMTSFCIIVAPIAFLGLGAMVDKTIILIRKKIRPKAFDVVTRIVLALVIGYFLLNITRIANYHTPWKPNDNCGRQAEMEALSYLPNIPDSAAGRIVVFTPIRRVNFQIPVMFFTGHTAYNGLPNPEQTAFLKNSAYRIVVLDNDSLPDYIRQDSSILKVKRAE